MKHRHFRPRLRPKCQPSRQLAAVGKLHGMIVNRLTVAAEAIGVEEVEKPGRVFSAELAAEAGLNDRVVEIEQAHVEIVHQRVTTRERERIARRKITIQLYNR